MKRFIGRQHCRHYRWLWLMAMAAVLAVGMLGLSGCGDKEESEGAGKTVRSEAAYPAFAESLDLEFAKEVNQKIASFGDDAAVGMRSAGSPAELETCEYLEGVMKEIGLQNVTVDETTLDCWTFNGANITFQNAEGQEQKIDLGGYQTTLQAENEEVEVVDVDRGTIDDYEGLDVKGKLVLLDVNQEEDWWINYPAYQAKLKGAKAVLAMREFVEEGDDRIGVQDVCGPADAPALAISHKDAEALRAAIKKSGGKSVKVTLNCDSKVTENGTSHNLYGEIPGSKYGEGETIFVFAHMDGYFHAAYDDAQGAAVSMAIAKAMIDCGYQPDRTIRFCIHGAEEWGREGSEYDWSAGAYEEIMTNHPEWADGAIAIVNNDGGYSVKGENCKGIMVNNELLNFVDDSVGKLVEKSKTEWTYSSLSTYTEDFMWTRQGIPAISAGDGDGHVYDDKAYHSTYDSWDVLPVDDDKYMEFMQVYGKMVIDLDAKAVRPLDFSTRLEIFRASLNEDAEEQFEDVLDDADEAAAELQDRMDEVEATGIWTDAKELNVKTQAVFKQFQDSLLGLDFLNVDAVIRHDMYEDNIEYLDGAIDELKAGNIQSAFDEYLSAVDWSWYDMYFDEETCEYMKDQLFDKRKDTWGADLIEWRHADTGDIVRSLKEKRDQKDPDLTDEIKALEEVKKTQEEHLQDVYDAEIEGLEKTIKLMKEAAEE